MNINIPNGANYLIKVLQSHGFEAYVVGGCVRDALLGKEPHDWDLCTNATPEEMLKFIKWGSFTDPFNKESAMISAIVKTGIDYGTVTFTVDDIPYEITTFRKETGYSDGRHPDNVDYANTIEEDLARRDFTVNAMAYNHTTGLIDPYNGQKDLLEEKVLRCVGDPTMRFEEDGLRILRALRFASKYGLSIAPETSIAMHAKRKNLKNVSVERQAEELKKILTEDCSAILSSYSDIVCEIIPELADCVGFRQKNPYHQHDVYTHILETIRNCPSKDVVTRLALFFHDIGKPKCAVKDSVDQNRLHFYGHGEVSAEIADTVLKRLHFDNVTKNAVVELVEQHDAQFTVSERFVRKWLHRIGKDQFERLIDIRESDIKGQRKEYYEERLQKVDDLRALYSEMMQKEQCFSLKDLNINGKDLIGIGYTPGKELGATLNELLELVINGELENDEQMLLERANCWLSREDDDREM